jgi:hypothetical protein
MDPSNDNDAFHSNASKVYNGTYSNASSVSSTAYSSNEGLDDSALCNLHFAPLLGRCLLD